MDKKSLIALGSGLALSLATAAPLYACECDSTTDSACPANVAKTSVPEATVVASEPDAAPAAMAGKCGAGGKCGS